MSTNLGYECFQLPTALADQSDAGLCDELAPGDVQAAQLGTALADGSEREKYPGFALLKYVGTFRVWKPTILMP